MSTDATTAPQWKRICFDNDTFVENNKDLPQGTSKSPTVAAKGFISSRVESLHPSIQQSVLNKTHKFLKIKTGIFEKEKRQKKLDDPDYIPNSCRVNFQLTRKLESKDDPDFTTLSPSKRKWTSLPSNRHSSRTYARPLPWN